MSLLGLPKSPVQLHMRFDVIALFPELIQPYLRHGVTRRAFEGSSVAGINVAPAVDVRLWALRDFADGTYRRVDDRPFGGGPGMVLMAEPLRQCLLSVRADRAESAPAPVVLFSPAGRVLNHQGVEGWAQSSGAVLVCGRYEGIDQRFVDAFVDVQLSLGDFVISGGELAAVALLDAVARLQPGVLHDAESHRQDSFNPAVGGLLDCPHFTRPEIWSDGVTERRVPEVLMSGHHAQIQSWRMSQRLAITQSSRPDLMPDRSPKIDP